MGMQMTELRAIIRLIEDEWQPCKMQELKPNDIFKMLEDDHLVMVNDCLIWQAMDWPAQKHGVWGVESLPNMI